MKIWLDDTRQSPKGWERCFRPEQVIELLTLLRITHISLDYDLSKVESSKTGYEVIEWIIEEISNDKWWGTIPVITCHSDSVVGSEKINKGIQKIRELAISKNIPILEG